jgi:hypothetical protein
MDNIHLPRSVRTNDGTLVKMIMNLTWRNMLGYFQSQFSCSDGVTRLVGLTYMRTICVLVKTGTLLTYRNIRTAMDVKQQTRFS